MGIDAGTVYSEIRIQLDKLNADIQAVTANFDKIGAESQKMEGRVSDSGKKIQASAEAQREKIEKLKGAYQNISVAVAAAIGFAKKLLDTWAEQELATARLTNAVKISGVGYSGLTENLVDFSTEMQRATGINDDLIQNLSAQALVMGRTEEQTKDLIKAASQLASTGLMDVNEAFKALAATYDGMQPRNMLLRTMLGELNEAELKNGKAIADVIEKTKGMNEVMMATTSGGMLNLKNAFGDLAEAGGRALAIMANPAFKELSNVLNKLSDAMNKAFDLRDAQKAFKAGTATISQELQVANAAFKEHQKMLYDLTLEYQRVRDASSASFRGGEAERTRTLEGISARIKALRQETEEWRQVAAAAQKKQAAEQEVAAAQKETVETQKTAKAELDQSILTTEEHVARYMQTQRNQLALDQEQIEKGEALFERTKQKAEELLDKYAFIGDATKGLFKEMGRDLMKGELNWENFGKAAVHALGKIISGFGDLLAADAAADLVKAIASLASIIFAWMAPGLFESAAIKAAGAAVAYITGAALEAYETGGIVLPQGDGKTVRVAENGSPEMLFNAGASGEAFVNQFAAAVAEKLGGTGGGVANITIQVDGAAIGRLITRLTYDGKTRIYKGVVKD